MSTINNLSRVAEDETNNAGTWSSVMREMGMPIKIQYAINPLTQESEYSEDNETVERQEKVAKAVYNINISKSLMSLVSKPPASEFEEIQQIWDGVVIDFNGKEVTARITDKTNPDMPEEEVVIKAKEIDDRELSLCRTGAMFYWHIGYRIGEKLTKERISKIVFRRLPRWGEHEIAQAKKSAKEYSDYFISNRTDATTS